MLFDSYLAADYSGAEKNSAQRKSICVAVANGRTAPFVDDRRFTRGELVNEFFNQLERATETGRRVCLGQDHQYGIPFGLGKELGISSLPWREALNRLRDGSYGENAPKLSGARTFAPALNEWLVTRGQQAFFYSATKSKEYGIPNRNPRANDTDIFRLTERCRPSCNSGAPKAFNRVGDRGTVGGQTLVGLIAIHDLLARCHSAHIPIRCWPFDGLSITSPVYENAHVLVEPYPSAVRSKDVVQSDRDDALASVALVQGADLDGTLSDLLDVSALSPEDSAVVLFEGWILSHLIPSPVE